MVKAVTIIRCHVGMCHTPTQCTCMSCGKPVCYEHSTEELADMYLQISGLFCSNCWEVVFMYASKLPSKDLAPDMDNEERLGGRYVTTPDTDEELRLGALTQHRLERKAIESSEPFDDTARNAGYEDDYEGGY